jgi:hypothetical protein
MWWSGRNLAKKLLRQGKPANNVVRKIYGTPVKIWDVKGDAHKIITQLKGAKAPSIIESVKSGSVFHTLPSLRGHP